MKVMLILLFSFGSLYGYDFGELNCLARFKKVSLSPQDKVIEKKLEINIKYSSRLQAASLEIMDISDPENKFLTRSELFRMEEGDSPKRSLFHSLENAEVSILEVSAEVNLYEASFTSESVDGQIPLLCHQV